MKLSAPSTASTSSAVRAVPRPSPVTVDPSKPKGNIQIRLGDGGRLVVSLNHTHTLRDLKQEIKAKQPSEDGRDFNLVSMGSPGTVFSELNKSISELGLISTAVLQR